MLIRLTDSAGQPRYLQLMQQIRHAIESGALHDGDQLPSIRTLAEELVVSPGTVVKAYTELEREGVIQMQHGAGAFVCLSRRARRLGQSVRAARERIDELIGELREEGLLDDEIRRMFEAGLLSANRARTGR
jgi:GntR family transcriptional regulator